MEQKPLNLAARAGRWSATHWKTATAIWVVVVLAAMAEQSTGETARAEKILAGAGFSTPANESVLVKSSSLRFNIEPELADEVPETPAVPAS